MVSGACREKTLPPYAPSDQLKLIPPTPRMKDGVVEQPVQFEFEGIYEVVGAERFGDARRLTARTAREDLKYEDGALELCVHATPYGVRLRIKNLRPHSIVLDGARASLIDIGGQSWAAELRDPSALFPEDLPTSQLLTIPPDTSTTIDLDVVTPKYRPRILRSARSEEERGAYMLDNPPLPVFCSGYYVYPSRQPEIDRLRQWALGQTFGVYIEFRGDRESFAYRLAIKPRRFGNSHANLGNRCQHLPAQWEPETDTEYKDRTDAVRAERLSRRYSPDGRVLPPTQKTGP
jgi:hypothetical protein